MSPKAIVLVLAIASLSLLGGCASTPGTPSPGLGLYPTFDAPRIAEKGYPNNLDQPYWWPAESQGEWGILYDDEGVPYGPNTYYHFKTRLNHPDLVVTDSTMTGRWFTINRSDNVREEMTGRWLELHDLFHQDMKDALHFTPKGKIQIYAAPTLKDYKKVTGKDFWVTQVVDGPFIAYEPIGVLWSRTLALHAIRNGVATSFLDMKCHGNLPQWLRAGLASYLAEEGGVLEDFMVQFRGDRSVLLSSGEVLRTIYPLTGKEDGRIAQYNAFLMAWHLAQDYGWARVVQLLDLLQQGVLFEEAVPRVYGVSVPRLLELLDPQRLGDPGAPRSESPAVPAQEPDTAPKSGSAPQSTDGGR